MSVPSTIRLLGRALRHPIRETRFLRRLADRPRAQTGDPAVTLRGAVGRRRRRPPSTLSTDTPFPVVDLDTISDPIPAILATPEFPRTVAILADAPTAKRSLLSVATQALAYTLIRNARPAHVFEIGTYHGGTTEVMAQALLANGSGAIHTVGPFDEATFAPVFATWHPDLQRILRFYPSDSMAFYMGVEAQDIRAGLVLVDGNHDYEYAAFDIFSAARQLNPGGFIIVDNIAQAGPFLAVRDFLAQHPDWIDCGLNTVDWDRGKSFDTERCRIPNTDAAILRAPTHSLARRPSPSGQRGWRAASTIHLLGRALRHPIRETLFLRRLAERPGHLSALAPVRLPGATGRRHQRPPSGLLTDIPFPVVDLDSIGDPVPAILAAPEFQRTVAILADAPTAKRSLLSAATQALAYTLIRNARPAHVFEIGTYYGGTTEVMTQALLANGNGAMHSVGPFDETTFAVFATWHPDLQRILRFYPSDSMALYDSMGFYMGVEAQDITAGLVLVDGNHDYEYTAFDIFSAARQLTPGGFVIVDNIAQAVPVVRDFLAQHPGWIDCGPNAVDWDRGKSFNTERCRIPDIDAAILRAPTHSLITHRPSTSGQQGWRARQVRGLTLLLAGRPTSGQLFVQCVLRGFAEDRIVELVTEASVDVQANADLKNHLTIVFDKPKMVETGLLRYTVEPWFIWTGSEPLQLVAPPAIL